MNATLTNLLQNRYDGYTLAIDLFELKYRISQLILIIFENDALQCSSSYAIQLKFCYVFPLHQSQLLWIRTISKKSVFVHNKMFSSINLRFHFHYQVGNGKSDSLSDNSFASLTSMTVTDFQLRSITPCSKLDVQLF